MSRSNPCQYNSFQFVAPFNPLLCQKRLASSLVVTEWRRRLFGLTRRWQGSSFGAARKLGLPSGIFVIDEDILFWGVAVVGEMWC